MPIDNPPPPTHTRVVAIRIRLGGPMYYRLPLLALLSLAAAVGTAFAVTVKPALVKISKGGTDSYVWAPYGYNTSGPHPDTCNGDQIGAYTCPNGVIKDCVDVVRTMSYIDAKCTWSPWISSSSGFSDTCNGDNNHVYTFCEKTCTDRDCTDWVAGKCVNRSHRFINYYPFVPPMFRDRTVKCR